MQIFCSGIGGIGLSAYASLQKVAGHTVSGSDRSRSALLDDLESQGIVISTDQSGAAIPEKCDVLVYSEAIPPTASERVKAKERRVPQMSYPQALGEMSRGYQVIAVCGTHGKSSTTAMSARLLIECGLDPTVVVGTKLKELNGRNWRKGNSQIFVLEACEYRRSFSFYHPRIILMTNADGDHFDYYQSTDDYRKAFVEFVGTLPKEGSLITHMSDEQCHSIADTAVAAVTDADQYPLLSLGTPGLHMRQNAQLVLALADLLKIDKESASKAVSGYAGSWRRMEVRGQYNKTVTVIDDYGHHPKEIAATLQAIKEQYPTRRLVCAFQPHTHDRTLKLYEDFTRAFVNADFVVVSSVYEARKDIERSTVDLAAFTKDIGKGSGKQTVLGNSLEETEEVLKRLLEPNDVLVFMGAGDITNLAAKMSQ